MGFDVSGRGRDGTYGATISDATQHKTVICNSMVYMKLSFKLVCIYVCRHAYLHGVSVL